MLIHRLHKAGETHIAEKIKTNAEPHQGEWVYRDESLSSVYYVCGGQSGGMYAPLLVYFCLFYEHVYVHMCVPGLCIYNMCEYFQ